MFFLYVGVCVVVWMDGQWGSGLYFLSLSVSLGVRGEFVVFRSRGERAPGWSVDAAQLLGPGSPGRPCVPC